MVKPSRHSDPSASEGSGRLDDLADLPALRPLPTAAERAAEVIRENIFEGRFAPGTPLPEAALSKALQVSRNTVREAFRMLTSEHLLTYEAHRGVMVRWLSEVDVGDIYRLRRMFELAALDHAIDGRHELDVSAIGDLVTTAERAAAAGRWKEVGTVNLRFHEQIVAAQQSPRINEVFRRLMTEIRLGFLVFTDPAELHGDFVPRNRELHGLIAGGDLRQARAELAIYLDEAEHRITTAIRGSSDRSGRSGRSRKEGQAGV
ncbi:MAG TPA: GntR family transcriptional regulator [Streptosporangiaceae bacterium]|jgi:DNA-binding GntR family transcriptional regulator|nr:GntR family transcriptional regulator [Streptosporangiaceae bacterium]